MYPLAFVGFSVFVSFGGGFGPATQSLALELYNARSRMLGHVAENEAAEAGKLFGALSVLQAMAYVITFSYSLFGFVFDR